MLTASLFLASLLGGFHAANPFPPAPAAVAVAPITGPQADLNLGLKTFLNGTLVSNIVIDTSAVATDTIDYVATDSAGLTATSTRTIIIEPQTMASSTASSTSQ